MTIAKGEKVYTVQECADHWVLTWNLGAVTASFHIPKSICATVESLADYVRSTDGM